MIYNSINLVLMKCFNIKFSTLVIGLNHLRKILRYIFIHTNYRLNNRRKFTLKIKRLIFMIFNFKEKVRLIIFIILK